MPRILDLTLTALEERREGPRVEGEGMCAMTATQRTKRSFGHAGMTKSTRSSREKEGWTARMQSAIARADQGLYFIMDPSNSIMLSLAVVASGSSPSGFFASVFGKGFQRAEAALSRRYL